MTTAVEKLKCINRELAMRFAVYPRFVREGKMTTEEMEYEILCMKAIREDYIKLADAEEEAIAPRLKL